MKDNKTAESVTNVETDVTELDNIEGQEVNSNVKTDDMETQEIVSADVLDGKLTITSDMSVEEIAKLINEQFDNEVKLLVRKRISKPITADRATPTVKDVSKASYKELIELKRNNLNEYNRIIGGK